MAIDETVSPPRFLHGGRRETETHYSASLVKVAAMYAAFELKRSADALAASSGVGNWAALHARLNAEFDPPIDIAVPAISRAPDITAAMRVPKYAAILTAVPRAGGGVSVEFTGGFDASLRRAIVNSDKDAAAACIQALAYSWINGALEHGAFFAPPDGVWLAGTFNRSWPYVRISSVNDGAVAQATTTIDLANMYAHMVQGTLVDADSSVRIASPPRRRRDDRFRPFFHGLDSPPRRHPQHLQCEPHQPRSASAR